MSLAALDVDPAAPAFYEGVDGDASAAQGGPAVVFRYVPAGASDGAVQSDPVISRADDPAVGWDDPDGVQLVAQAILEHFTGEEPDQATLEALAMDQGDDWAASATWRLTVDDLDRILNRP